jgi:hypothetical protein
MYRFSLSEFNKLFVSAFAQCTDTDDCVRKIVMIFNSLTYSYFSHSLFREHRLVLGLSLLKAVCPKMFVDQERR